MHVLLVARRDLMAYLHGFSGYAVIAAVLFIDGLLFHTWAMGTGPQLSHEVLEKFFEFSGGLVMITGVLLTMRSIAEERQTGTEVLLQTSSAREWEVVLGKYAAAMAVIGLILGLSVYMPALIFVNGKVSIGHIGVGYLGLFCLGSAAVSVGIAASSLARTQVAAGMLAGVTVVTMLLGWKVSDLTDAPFTEVFAYAALWDKHFTTFQEGRLLTRDLMFYGSITFLFLALATKVLEGRRWQ